MKKSFRRRHFLEQLESRILFAIESGATLSAPSSFSDAATTDLAAARSENALNYASVRDFGAKGDGTTNDTAAIQAAIDSLGSAGGKVYVPASASFYLITRPIVLRDNITLYGDGYASHIRNAMEVEAVPGMGRVLDFGNLLLKTFDDNSTTEVAEIGDDRKSLRLARPEDANALSPGDIIWVKASKSTDVAGNQLQANEILTINRVDGTLTFSKKWLGFASEDGLLLGKTNGTDTDGTGTVRRIVKNTNITDLRLTTAAPTGWWHAAGGSWNCTFSNLHTESWYGIGLNGMFFCTFRNIHSQFGYRFVEFAAYSHDNVIEGMNGTFAPFYERAPSHQPLISFGEYSNRNSLSDWFLDADGSQEGNLFRAGSGNIDNTVTRGKAFVRGLKGSIISYSSSEGTIARNRVSDLEVWANGTFHIEWASRDGVADFDNTFSNVLIHGVPRVSGVNDSGVGRPAGIAIIERASSTQIGDANGTEEVPSVPEGTDPQAPAVEPPVVEEPVVVPSPAPPPLLAPVVPPVLGSIWSLLGSRKRATAAVPSTSAVELATSQPDVQTSAIATSPTPDVVDAIANGDSPVTNNDPLADSDAHAALVIIATPDPLASSQANDIESETDATLPEIDASPAPLPLTLPNAAPTPISIVSAGPPMPVADDGSTAPPPASALVGLEEYVDKFYGQLYGPIQ